VGLLSFGDIRSRLNTPQDLDIPFAKALYETRNAIGHKQYDDEYLPYIRSKVEGIKIRGVMNVTELEVLADPCPGLYDVVVHNKAQWPTVRKYPVAISFV